MIIEILINKLKDKIFKNEHEQFCYNLGYQDAQKEFVEKMVLMLSKHFQSTSNNDFVQMELYSYNDFCIECYDYLKSLGEKGK